METPAQTPVKDSSNIFQQLFHHHPISNVYADDDQQEEQEQEWQHRPHSAVDYADDYGYVDNSMTTELLTPCCVKFSDALIITEVIICS